MFKQGYMLLRLSTPIILDKVYSIENKMVLRPFKKNEFYDFMHNYQKTHVVSDFQERINDLFRRNFIMSNDFTTYYANGTYKANADSSRLCCVEFEDEVYDNKGIVSKCWNYMDSMVLLPEPILVYDQMDYYTNGNTASASDMYRRFDITKPVIVSQDIIEKIQTNYSKFVELYDSRNYKYFKIKSSLRFYLSALSNSYRTWYYQSMMMYFIILEMFVVEGNESVSSQFVNNIFEIKEGLENVTDYVKLCDYSITKSTLRLLYDIRSKIAHGRTDEMVFEDSKYSRFIDVVSANELLRVMALDVMLLNLHGLEKQIRNLGDDM